jgi:hypothetical protein
MRKKINSRVIQSKLLDISNVIDDVRKECSRGNRASHDTPVARYVSAYHVPAGTDSAHVDSYA